VIDIGVNLTNARFAEDLQQVLERADAAGVKKILITGTSLATSKQAIKLCQQYTFPLFSTVGIHPHDADMASENFISELVQLASSPYVKAIGECGLDFNRNFSTPDNQVNIFKAQITLAAKLNMPLFLHQRDAFEPWFSLLQPYIDKVPTMVAHCFTGTKSQLLKCLDAGMYIGITGWVCDQRRGCQLQDIVKHIPLERLLIETDAPYLLPKNIKPRPKRSRNEPAYLPYVAQTLAEFMPYSLCEIIEQTRLNAEKVFRLLPQQLLLERGDNCV
jgi:TatD DNase family protein